MFNNFNILSDFINRLNISQSMNFDYFIFIYSNFIFSISRILLFEGYIRDLFIIFFNNFCYLVLFLKYYNNLPVIKVFKKISNQYKKKYKSYNMVPMFFNNIGIIIISTNIGVVTDKLSKILGVGGKLICYVF